MRLRDVLLAALAALEDGDELEAERLLRAALRRRRQAEDDEMLLRLARGINAVDRAVDRRRDAA